MSSSKIIYLLRDLAAGIYQSLKTGDIVSFVGIFYPALWTVAILTYSLIYSPPSPPSLSEQCVGGGGVWASGPQTEKNLPQSPFAVKCY